MGNFGPFRPIRRRNLNAPLEDRWLSMDEICSYLGVSNDTVYKWIDKFSMPAHRMGHRWKFKTAEVDAWVKEGGAAAHQHAKKRKK